MAKLPSLTFITAIENEDLLHIVDKSDTTQDPDGSSFKASISQVKTNFESTFEKLSNKGIAQGYAPLDTNNLIPSIHLPSYVDDVLEFADFVSLPLTGETGKIYLTLNDSLQYRWSGSAYIEITDKTAVWGQVSGILSNQTDLQNALNLKENLSNKNNTILNASSTEYPTSGLIKNNLDFQVINTSVAVTNLTDTSRPKILHIGNTFGSAVNLTDALFLSIGKVYEVYNDSLAAVNYFASDGVTLVHRSYPKTITRFILKDNSTSNGVWTVDVRKDSGVMSIVEEFIFADSTTVVGENGWTSGNTLTGAITVNATGVRLATGTNAGGRASIRSSLGISHELQNTVDESVRVYTAKGFTSLVPTALQSFFMPFGVGDSGVAEPATGAYFYIDQTSTFWQCKTARAGTRTAAITTVPIVANQVLNFRIEFENRTNRIDFYINNALVATITTNTPQTVSSLMAMVQKTVGTTTADLVLDYVTYDIYRKRS